MTQYTRSMLPILGVVWHYFPTEHAAQAFARWAVQETRNSSRPCRVTVSHDSDMPTAEQFRVRVANW